MMLAIVIMDILCQISVSCTPTFLTSVMVKFRGATWKMNSSNLEEEKTKVVVIWAKQNLDASLFFKL